jgi:pyruvate ferredoxin oxidoreductase alpha subunit
MTKPEYADALKSFQDEVDRRWRKVKAKHDNPEL